MARGDRTALSYLISTARGRGGSFGRKEENLIRVRGLGGVKRAVRNVSQRDLRVVAVPERRGWPHPLDFIIGNGVLPPPHGLI